MARWQSRVLGEIGDTGRIEVGGFTCLGSEQSLRDETQALSSPKPPEPTSIFHRYLAPGGCLPPELLAKTFVHSVPWPTPSKPWVEKPTSRWIRVSHVCRYWREVALSTPELWSFIDFNKPLLAKELVARSKAIPISAQMNFYAPPPPISMSVLDHLSRTAMLSLRMCEVVSLHKAQLAPAPYLNTLSIAISYGLFWGRPWIISGFLENLVAPSLQHLEIRYWMIPWDHPIYRPTITTLVLELDREHINDVEVLSLEWNQMLDALNKMQLLQTLSLENIAEPPSSLPSHSITLPKLSSLHLLSSPACSCGLFLARCSLPGLALSPSTLHRFPRNTFLISLSASGKPSPDTTWDLSIMHNPEKEYRYSWLYRLTESDESEGVDKPSINLVIDNRDVFVSRLSDLGMSISGIKSLQIEDISGSNAQEAWIEFAYDIPNLPTLVVRGEGAVGLLSLVLYHDPTIHTSWKLIYPPQTMFSFPHLRTLVLERVDLDSYFFREKYAALLDALHKRKVNGLKLDKLKFVDVKNMPAGQPERLALSLGCEVEVSSTE